MAKPSRQSYLKRKMRQITSKIGRWPTLSLNTVMRYKPSQREGVFSSYKINKGRKEGRYVGVIRLVLHVLELLLIGLTL